MSSPAPVAVLTDRESEVLALVRRRLTNAEIAAELYVSVRTVESHVSSVLRKLGANSRRELAAMPGAPTAERGRRPLPALRTELIGRDDELQNVAGLVRRARLSTLVGPGGVGKTTVALAVAHQHADRWPDGVTFVDLVPARTPGDLLRTIGESLGIDGDASRSLHDLANHLATLRTLVVMDNCEHVVGHVGELLHAVLGRDGGSHVLATSREPLGLAEEHLVPIDPLGDSAARLFVERARQSEPRVAWDEGDERIVELCAHLDGLPLALELAAGQLRRWDLDELHRQLVGSKRRLPERPLRGESRHRTMEQAIDWSYELLDEAEQQLLRRLGVFPSTFRLDALRSVLGLPDAGAPVDTLASLVDKSLVVRELDGSYRLLEVIRSFALQRLDDRDERDAAFEQHRRWVVDRATSTSRLDRWFSARLAAEQTREADHVRQAFWGSLRSGHTADAVDLAMTRSLLWRNAVGCAEGYRWVESLADRDLTPADAVWVGVLGCDVAQGDGDFRRMVASADRALQLAAGDEGGPALALARHFAALRHLLDAAKVDEAFSYVRRVSPDERLANLVGALSLCAHAGRLPLDDMTERIGVLHARCSSDGYDRFISNWATWMHGLVLRDVELARAGIDRQYEFLDHVGLPETWLTAYSLAVTQMIDGVSGRAQLAHARAIAEREGYRIDGDCMLALSYSEVCAGNPVAAAELLGLAGAVGFNATAHDVLHGIVVDPLVRGQLGVAEFAESVGRGTARPVASMLEAYGIGESPTADR